MVSINADSVQSFQKFFDFVLIFVSIFSCVRTAICKYILRAEEMTDDPPERTWAKKRYFVRNSSVYKRGQADASSFKTNYLCSSSVQTNLLA